jgi:hypothetical protein
MLKIEKRVLTISEALCSVLHGDIVPSIFEIDEVKAGPDTKWEPGVALLSYRLKRCKLRPSPLSEKNIEEKPVPTYKPKGLASHQWVKDMLERGAVLAALPEKSPKLALSHQVACGSPKYWLDGLVVAASYVNEFKTRPAHSSNRTHFETNALFDSLPSFLPEGDAYGLSVAAIDALIDAGVCVEIRKRPYGYDERVSVADASRRSVLCARELALTLDAAQLGVGPAVFASFYAERDDREVIEWKGAMQAGVDRKSISPENMQALITVSQLHTFSLDSLMEAYVKAPVPSRREYLRGALQKVCKPVFDKIKCLIEPAKGCSVLKLNMTPVSVVFCPRLNDEDGRWKVKGVGFMPMSRDFLDGEPFLTDFNAMLTSPVPEAAQSPDVSFVLHSLLLVAFTRARHGKQPADVLWQHLTGEGDVSGFVGATKRVSSKQVNASAFLANLVANSEMREDSDLSKAVAEAVSDIDSLVRVGVLSDDGNFAQPPEKAVFTKLVGLVTGLSAPDTRIFDWSAAETGGGVDVDTFYALEALKAARVERLKGVR